MRLARHSMTLAWRSLWHTRRTPEELIDVTLQPILFLTIFTFIFGGAIAAAVSGTPVWIRKPIR